VQFEDPTGELMMLPSDMALIWDKTFRRHVVNYAADEEQFFKDFSKVRKTEKKTDKKVPALVAGRKTTANLAT
jgi:catalase (peroxidase I)